MVSSQGIVQLCLFLFAAIGLIGGTLQILGVPEPTAIWLGYLASELLVLWIMIGAQFTGTFQR